MDIVPTATWDMADKLFHDRGLVPPISRCSIRQFVKSHLTKFLSDPLRTDIEPERSPEKLIGVVQEGAAVLMQILRSVDVSSVADDLATLELSMKKVEDLPLPVPPSPFQFDSFIEVG